MRAPRLITLAAGALSVTVLALGAAGCGGSSSSASKSSSHPSSSASTALVQNSLPPASSIVNDLDKRKAVVITKCAAVDGGWAASGTIKNAGAADATYAITVFFTNEHATVQDYATASVTVKPGQSTDWTASKRFAAANPTNCVLRGVG